MYGAYSGLCYSHNSYQSHDTYTGLLTLSKPYNSKGSFISTQRPAKHEVALYYLGIRRALRIVRSGRFPPLLWGAFVHDDVCYVAIRPILTAHRNTKLPFVRLYSIGKSHPLELRFGFDTKNCRIHTHCHIANELHRATYNSKETGHFA